MPRPDGIGEKGSILIDNTDAQTTRCYAIAMLEDTVFSALTCSGLTVVGSAISGFTFPKGFVFYGQITGFTLSSGSCVAYKQG